MVCDWCSSETEHANKYDVGNITYDICNKCLKALEDGECILCGDSLLGEYTLDGLCSGCRQIKAAKAERKRSEVMNGLGVNVLSELLSPTEFTEKDYEEWVTFEQSEVKPENRRVYRRAWIKNKLIGTHTWESASDIKENIEDIEYLMDAYLSKIFNSSCTFILDKGNNKDIRGLGVVARRGKVVVVESSVDSEDI